LATYLEAQARRCSAFFRLVSAKTTLSLHSSKVFEPLACRSTRQSTDGSTSFSLKGYGLMRWEYSRDIAKDGPARHHIQLAAEIAASHQPMDLDKLHLPSGWVAIAETLGRMRSLNPKKYFVSGSLTPRMGSRRRSDCQRDRRHDPHGCVLCRDALRVAAVIRCKAVAEIIPIGKFLSANSPNSCYFPDR